MKKGAIIGIVIAVVIVVIVIVGISTFTAGEQVSPNSNERYVLIPQIQREIYGMESWDKHSWVHAKYKGNPIYDYECQRIWYEFNSPDSTAELWFIMRDVCNYADIKNP